MILLDTHVIVWLDEGLELSPASIDIIEKARRAAGLLISAVSGWELGMLVSKGRMRLDLEPRAWLQRFASSDGVRVAPLTLDAASASSFLPGHFHGDPADRLLIASARELGARFVTRDRPILDYAKATGCIEVVPC